MVTLTRPADPDEDLRWDHDALKEAVRHVSDSIGPWWRRTPWGRQKRDPDSRKKRSRKDTSAVVALEIAPGGMVHAHVLVYGEYVPQADLQMLWSDVLGADLAIVDIRSVGDDVTGGIREALKYATKAVGEDRVPRAAAVELAFRNTNRVRVIGALRQIRCRSERGDVDDVTDEDLHDHHTATCEACGLVGSWLYCQIQADRITVADNGGFGMLRAPPPT
jgi:hypothetical protein